MKIWLDTTEIKLVQNALKFGLLAGVTTNPSLIAQSGRDLEEVCEDLLHYQEGPVAVQVIEEEANEMVQRGQTLYAKSNRLIIKVPMTKNGLEAIHLLSRQGIPTMATVIFQPHQALMAALAGADYIAPYLGHIEKNGKDPWGMLRSIVHIFDTYKIKTKILGASLLNVEYVLKCAEVGIYGVTVKESVFESLIETYSMTQERVDLFAKDAGFICK